VLLNGRPLRRTLQVPDGALKPGVNTILVRMSPKTKDGERLVSSTVRLASVSRSGYSIVAYGQNRLTFRNLRHRVSVADAAGQAVPVRTETAGAFTHVSFEGRGPHAVTLR
jgi:hypothetical protein